MVEELLLVVIVNIIIGCQQEYYGNLTSSIRSSIKSNPSSIQEDDEDNEELEVFVLAHKYNHDSDLGIIIIIIIHMYIIILSVNQ